MKLQNNQYQSKLKLELKRKVLWLDLKVLRIFFGAEDTFKVSERQQKKINQGRKDTIEDTTMVLQFL